MAQVIMPEQKKGAMDTVTGLLNTASTISSLRKDLKKKPGDETKPTDQANLAMQRRMKTLYGVT